MSKYKIELNGYSFYEQKQLTHLETMELLSIYQQDKNEQAKEKLIYSNLKLVLSLVAKYSKNNDNMEDLFQVGIIGLIKAIENFNLSYNLKFSTYAVPLILGEIKKYIRDNSSLRIPRSLRDVAYKIMNENEDYLKTYNKDASVDELSHRLGIDQYTIVEAISSTNQITSLSQEIQNDGQGSIDLESQIPDLHNNYDHLNDMIDLKNALNKLSDLEYNILNKRYYDGKTQMDLAEELSVSQAQISRIEKRALSNLKKIMSI